MSVKQIIGSGLARVLGTGLIGDLAAAFQDSLSRGATAIALGLSAEGAGVLTRLGQGTRRALAPNLAQAYASKVERDYLIPYAAARALPEQDLPHLRRRTLDVCQALAQRRAQILTAEDLDDTTLAGLAQGAFRDDLSALLLARAAAVLPDLDEQVRGLLAHQGLMGDALLFFLRERLRADPRVRATLGALRREGLWADVRALKAAKAGDGPFLRLAADSEALRTLVEIRLDDLAGALAEIAGKLDAAVAAARSARDAAHLAGSKVDTLGDQLQEDHAGLGAQLDALPQAIIALLQRVLRSAGLGIRVTPGDEFTHHDRAALGLLRQAHAELVRMPPGPG